MLKNNSVIQMHQVQSEVIQITMMDRVNKNTFTEAFCQELTAAFAEVKKDDSCKVVVLTGYDHYFASGGTQEGLTSICEGKAQFTDNPIYSLAMDCEVPVVAAMQGHGIGGGFVLGLYCDIVVLGRESIYTANFMKYGFTPGFGATYILPRKLGFSLAEELMLNAGSYRGGELEKRGVPFAVLPREKVLEHALEVAGQLAEKPRVSLITLKNHLVGPLRVECAAYIEKEMAMHEKTFHLPEVKARILSIFGK